MKEEMWKRHANPWSVWTRFIAIPAMMLAIWSRIWLGWWAMIPIALVAAWLVANVLVFPPVNTPRGWASKGIYGERLWLKNKNAVPAHYARVQHWLIVLGIAGMLLIAGGLFLLHLWLSILGAVILILAQLWRIDRFSTLYELYEGKDE